MEGKKIMITKNDLKVVLEAIPNIQSGICGINVEEACEVLASLVENYFVDESNSPEKEYEVIFVAEATYKVKATSNNEAILIAEKYLDKEHYVLERHYVNET